MLLEQQCENCQEPEKSKIKIFIEKKKMYIKIKFCTKMNWTSWIILPLSTTSKKKSIYMVTNLH